MSFKLGRVTLEEPFTLRQSGDTLNVEGLARCGTPAAARAVRQQLLGLVGNVDEPVVPVTSSESGVDGYYRVAGITADTPRGGLSHLQWTAGLERVSDYSMPMIESVLLAPDTIRDNDHSVANSRVYHVLPVTATQRSLSVGIEPTFSSEDGDMSIVSTATDDISFPSTTAELIDGIEQYLLAPGDWYDGACRLELDYADDGTFRQVVGRQIPNLPGEQRWRVSNGIIRITLEDSLDMVLGVSRWTGSVWSTPTEFYLGRGPANRTRYDAPSTITVLRNSVEQTIVRFYTLDPQSPTGPVVVTMVLNRGVPWAEFQVTSGLTGVACVVEFGFNTTKASTVFDTTSTEANLDDAGLAATSADGDGFKGVLATAQTITTTETTEGILYLGAVTFGNVATFAIGLSEDDGSNGAPDTVEWVPLTYLAAQSETVRVVER